MRVLVTGATGYVGGRLVSRLLDAGHDVRVMVRKAGRVAGRPWADRVEVVEGDVLDAATLGDEGEGLGVCDGMDAAYYLVHAMAAGKGFAQRDQRGAANFASAANRSGVKHVIYLGGLVPGETNGAAGDGDLPKPEGISEHLRSRAETGAVLGKVMRGKVTEFRAGPVIGSGSASFEMVRYLTERLPAMVAPKWVNNEVQPIAVRDVLAYLVGALEREPMGVVDIGADVLTFKAMMLGYAEARGLKRWVVPVPVLAPKLAARWVGAVTPISNRLAVPLVAGMIRPLIGDTRKARALFPSLEPIGFAEAVRLALRRIEAGRVETRWSGSVGHHHLAAADIPHGGVSLEDWEGVIVERRVVDGTCTSEAMFRAFTSLGGETGWLVWRWAWALRGMLDSLVGGPGLRRGRRDPAQLLVGEALDFWRVESVDAERKMLLLRAEMRVPGRAWLRWEAVEKSGGGCRLEQIAFFEPRGLPGVLYWYVLYPMHRWIFTDMARAIAKRGARQESG